MYLFIENFICEYYIYIVYHPSVPGNSFPISSQIHASSFFNYYFTYIYIYIHLHIHLQTYPDESTLSSCMCMSLGLSIDNWMCPGPIPREDWFSPQQPLIAWSSLSRGEALWDFSIHTGMSTGVSGILQETVLLRKHEHSLFVISHNLSTAGFLVLWHYKLFALLFCSVPWDLGVEITLQLYDLGMGIPQSCVLWILWYPVITSIIVSISAKRCFLDELVELHSSIIT